MRTAVVTDAKIVKMLGVPIVNIGETECVAHVIESVARSVGGWIITCNVDIMRRHFFDESFRSLAAEATMIVADGMPLVWASRLQGTGLPERVTGASLFNTLSASAAAHGRSIFLLGGDPGTAENAAKILAQQYPDLIVAGTYCPAPGFDSYKGEIENIRAMLVRARPSIIYVALGCPKQELLIAKIRSSLPQSWWMGVGISFSFMCGSVKRAPFWMQRSGLEWLHRLWQEPRRLAGRYLVNGIPFAGYLLWNSTLKRFSRSKDVLG